MDALKRETVNDYTWNDLNCRRYVRHTKGRNQYEKEIKMLKEIVSLKKSEELKHSVGF